MSEPLRQALRERFGVKHNRSDDEGFSEQVIAEIARCVMDALGDVEKMRWTLDNVYTIARRETNRDDLRGRWGHVIRLCEAIGCQLRGVLRADLQQENK